MFKFTRFLFFLFLVIFSISEASAQITPSCGTDHLKALSEKEPALYQQQLMLEESTRKVIEEKLNRQSHSRLSSTVYNLPVVVHVMHLPGTPVGTKENITDAQIAKGIQLLNDGFRNSGEFAIAGGNDFEINFCLAVRDTNNWPTTGITRTATNLSNLDKSKNDRVLQNLDYWNTNDYVNIWLVNEITNGADSGVAGYAYLASAHGMSFDGLVMEARFFGVSKQASYVGVHELGHYFNLLHTFEKSVCSNNDCLADGDKVCDTPPDSTSLSYNCDSKINTCHSDEDDISTNNPFRPVSKGGKGDQPDAIDNYMDYGYITCMNKFSAGQKLRAQTTLTEIRKSLLQSNGCVPVTSPPVTAFTAANSAVCLGNGVKFYDLSQEGPTSWTWTFEGGTPSVSSERNPVIKYNSAGSYKVSLKTSNSIGDGKTVTYENYIYVNAAPKSACIVKSDSLRLNYQIGIFNVTLNTLNFSSAGSFDEKGYKDFACTAGTVLQAGKTYSLSVRVGFANPENLSVYIDYNNNGLFTDAGELAYMAPIGKQGIHTGTITVPAASVTNTLLRMRVISDLYTINGPCTNQKYGQAEDYSVVISSNPILAVSDMDAEKGTVEIIPNPFTESAVIHLSDSFFNNGEVSVAVTDITGAEVKSFNRVNENEVKLEKGNLKPGLYFYKISTGGNVVRNGKFLIQ